jgi:glycosyltransferase involved in cell wall biosynthesis
VKKICHFSSVHNGLDTRIFRKECVSLSKAGYDTHLVTNASPAEVAEAAQFGVTLHPLPSMPRGGRMSRILMHAHHCYQMARDVDADLYHFHDPELIPYGLMLSRAGKRVIYDVHEDLAGDIYSKDWVPPPVRRPVASLSRAMESYGAARFSAVVAATPFIGSIFRPRSQEVAVINNYPLADELPPSEQVDIRQREHVCYVGGLHPHRGIREMIKAMDSTDRELLLAGMFYSTSLREEVSKYAGWSKVKECGFVDRKSVSNIMSKSFSGLVLFYRVPNFIYAQPIKMFEYMSAGVPVIASNFPLWRDIIEGNRCGLCIDHNSIEAISGAIKYLWSHPEEVIRMGNNGRRAVEQFYRWDHEETKLLSLYRKLLT